MFRICNYCEILVQYLYMLRESGLRRILSSLGTNRSEQNARFLLASNSCQVTFCNSNLVFQFISFG